MYMKTKMNFIFHFCAIEKLFNTYHNLHHDHDLYNGGDHVHIYNNGTDNMTPWQYRLCQCHDYCDHTHHWGRRGGWPWGWWSSGSAPCSYWRRLWRLSAWHLEFQCFISMVGGELLACCHLWLPGVTQFLVMTPIDQVSPVSHVTYIYIEDNQCITRNLWFPSFLLIHTTLI